MGLWSDIRFWDNVWCGDALLKLEINGIYNVVVNGAGSVADNFEFGEGGSWIPRLRRNVNDWEFEELVRLLRCLIGFALLGGRVITRSGV